MAIKLPRQLRGVADRALLSKLKDGLERVEAGLLSATEHTDPIAEVATRHLVEAGGKRMRPVLVLLTAQLGDANDQRVIDAAVVVELTHLATLYHDDVMDDAPTRRGVATAQYIWGNNVAILTGDLLFARASQIVSRLGQDALTLQADTFERLCIGQLNETIGPAEGVNPREHYIRVLADKTGSLIAASAQMGAIFSGASSDVLEPLRLFGERIGVAFQLIDDVIDISVEGPSGKTPGTDLRAGVPTLPVLLLRERDDAESKALLAAIDSDLTDDAKLAGVVARLREHEVAELAYAEAKRWADDAISAISPLPEGSVKSALTAFAAAVVDRKN
jgi:heptaprenyl diphosphate synthase